MSNEVIEGFRLSPQQERLWRLAGGSRSGPFRAFCRVRVTGRIDAEVLRAAIGRAVARHEVLRTAFELLPGMSAPLQVISGEAAFGFERRDLAGLGEEERSAALAAILAAAEGRDFDTAENPLLRAVFVSLAEEDHRLILSTPALCADVPSLDNLLREIASLCDPAVHLPEPVQHVDLSEWQNELLESAASAAGRERWREAGGEAGPATRLPFRRPGPAGWEFSPAMGVAHLDREETAALERLAGELAVPSSTLVLAAWAVQLGRLTGEEETVVGAAFDGRKFEEVARAIGPFSRFVPVRVRLGADATFAGLVRQLAAALGEAEEWQEYFALEAAPFFALAFEPDPGLAPFEAGGRRFEMERRWATLDRFELKLMVARQGGRLRLEMAYDSALYGGEETGILLAQLAALLGAIAHRPETRLHDLSLLSGEERSRLLREVNDTRRTLTGRPTLGELFRAQAVRTPQRVALRAGSATLTYAELARRANRLARHLRRLGVAPEVRVALCLERSADLIVGMLGILGAGGAWVPPDPGQPRERLSRLLAEARPALVVTTGEHSSRVAAAGLPLVLLDRDASAIAAESPEPPESGAGRDTLAYVLYTSGSTGRPKGVMVAHGAIVNRLLWMADALAFQPEDRVPTRRRSSSMPPSGRSSCRCSAARSAS